MKRASRFLPALILLGSLSVWASPPQVILTDSARREVLQSEIMSESFQEKLDVVSGSKRRGGNEVLLLVNARMSIPVRYQLIDNAKRSIVISTFTAYADEKNGQITDESTRVLVEKLIAAKKRGVEIKVILDGASVSMAGSHIVVQSLRDAGIKVIKYNPIVSDDYDLKSFQALPHAVYRFFADHNPLRNRWHEKTMVIDGTYGIIGGINWGDLYIGNNFSSAVYSVKEFYAHPLIREIGVPPRDEWEESIPASYRDTDVLVKGPVVEEALRQLLLDFSLLDILNKKSRHDQYRDITTEDADAARTLFNREYQDNPIYFNGAQDDLVQGWGAAREPQEVRYISQRPFLERTFTENFNYLINYAKENDVYVNQENPSLRISNLYINLINKAQKQILWGCHSNRPTPEMLEALEAAALRGVQIIIIGNSQATANTLPDKGFLMYGKGEAYYKSLLRSGRGNIRIFEWQDKATVDGQELRSGAFHSKVFSVDGVISSIGSYNMASASFESHTEGTLVVNDAAFTQSVEEMFQKDLRFTKEVHLQNILDKEAERRRKRRVKSSPRH
ncbi:MAG: phosphatidylserine/phosphatidylglycerophosphate/cardiolipin synthase family protein [Bdellovibrionales bacterium]|nr:phosphatidylserine/phosphatidylglycerophosphate/cardiolipin synthase family protein [Bdellovibrionales bacterium]